MSRIIATFFGVGLLPWAPGTFASLVALPLAVALYAAGGLGAYFAALAAVLCAGYWSTAAALQGFEEADPGEIVIDEVAGQLIALAPLPLGLRLRGSDTPLLPWPGLLVGFVLFRAFDILKPWPVSLADGMHSPLGVMLDDVVAGLLAAAAVALAGYAAHSLMQ